MKRVQLLDCTLRDGGYLVDAQFGNTVIKGMIKGLSESGIDVVECGFLKDEPHQKGSTIFNNAPSSVLSYRRTDARLRMSVLLTTAVIPSPIWSHLTALPSTVSVPAFSKMNVTMSLISVKAL